MPTTTPVDLSDAALWQNGFPDDLFVELRRERPIFHHELTDGVAQTVKRDFWMTTKHRHAQRIHRDTDAFTAADGPLIQGIGPIGAFPNVITMDPPVLTKRRRVMSHAFTPKAIAKLEDGIRRRAAAMIDGLLEAGGGDWIEDVADVLPMSVIGDIVGIPDEDRPTIFDTLDRILKANEPDDPTNPGDHLELFGQIFTYATELTAEKRRNPTDDIWSTLTTAVVTDETGQELSIPANELEIFFFVLTLAGSDTTKNALAAGLQAFVANPGEIARYRDDESIRASAVEEVLRWSSPSRSGPAPPRWTWRWTASRSPRVIGWCRCCGRPTATRTSSKTPSGSTSAAPTIPMSPSAEVVHTTAWAPCSPAPKSVRPLTNCCCAPMTSASARPRSRTPT